MSSTSLITAAAESGDQPALSPYVVGALVLGILLVLMFCLTMFGKGRDHS